MSEPGYFDFDSFMRDDVVRRRLPAKIHTVERDDVLRSETIVEDGIVHNLLTQPTRDLILDRNSELRKNAGAIKKMEGLHWMLSIPFEDYYRLKRKYPDLDAPCSTTRAAAWARFMASAESAPFKVRDHEKKYH